MYEPGVLRNRSFLVLWGGNGVSLVGSWSVRLAYPLIVLVATGSPSLAGWVTFAASMPATLFQVPAGIAADLMNRRRIMLVSGSVGLVATVSAAAAILFDWPGLIMILIMTGFIEGTAIVFFGLAELGAIRDVVSEAQRPSAFSFYEAEQPVAILLGRALGGGLFGISRWLPFAVNAGSYLFCLAALATTPARLFAPRPDLAWVGGKPAPGRRVVEGLRLAWRVPFLRISTLIVGLTNIIFQTFVLLLIVVSTRDGQPAWVIGVIVACSGIGGIVASFASSAVNRRFATDTVFAACLWTWTALMLLAATTANPIVLATALAGVGAVGTISSVAVTIARVGSVPPATLGSVVGILQMVTSGAQPFGAVIAGYLIATVAPVAIGWLLFASMLALAILGSWSLWAARAAGRGSSLFDGT